MDFSSQIKAGWKSIQKNTSIIQINDLVLLIEHPNVCISRCKGTLTAERISGAGGVIRHSVKFNPAFSSSRPTKLENEFWLGSPHSFRFSSTSQIFGHSSWTRTDKLVLQFVSHCRNVRFSYNMPLYNSVVCTSKDMAKNLYIPQNNILVNTPNLSNNSNIMIRVPNPPPPRQSALLRSVLLPPPPTFPILITRLSASLPTLPSDVELSKNSFSNPEDVVAENNYIPPPPTFPRMIERIDFSPSPISSGSSILQKRKRSSDDDTAVTSDDVEIIAIKNIPTENIPVSAENIPVSAENIPVSAENIPVENNNENIVIDQESMEKSDSTFKNISILFNQKNEEYMVMIERKSILISDMALLKTYIAGIKHFSHQKMVLCQDKLFELSSELVSLEHSINNNPVHAFYQ